MTKYPILVKTSKKVKHPETPPIKPLRPYEQIIGWDMVSSATRPRSGVKGNTRGRRSTTTSSPKSTTSNYGGSSNG